MTIHPSLFREKNTFETFFDIFAEGSGLSGVTKLVHPTEDQERPKESLLSQKQHGLMDRSRHTFRKPNVDAVNAVVSLETSSPQDAQTETSDRTLSEVTDNVRVQRALVWRKGFPGSLSVNQLVLSKEDKS